jgi:hypothetical protein
MKDVKIGSTCSTFGEYKVHRSVRNFFKDEYFAGWGENRFVLKSS